MTNTEKLFLSFLYSGQSPKAPGTIGTIAAIPFGILFLYYLGAIPLLIITLLTTLLAIHKTNIFEKRSGSHDNQQIVIDEAVGVWLTIALSSFYTDNLLYLSILSFLTFRFFDILKPLGVGWIDKKMSGGKSVILDDILAGFYAAIINIIFFSLF